MIYVYEELSDCTRRRILTELLEGPMRVGELVERLGLKQPNVSNHLAKLRDRNLVKSERVGREIFYRHASKSVSDIVCQTVNRKRARSAGAEFEALAQALAERAVEGDENAAIAAVDWAIQCQTPVLDIYEQVIIPAISRADHLSEEAGCSISSEHLATAVFERVLAHVFHQSKITRKTDLVAVLGCAQNCWHTLGLRMIGDYLKVHGWKTFFLGANTPNDAFKMSIRVHKPDLLLISCTNSEALPTTVDLIKSVVTERGDKPTVVVGGQGAYRQSELLLSSGADYCPTSIGQFAREALPQIEKAHRP